MYSICEEAPLIEEASRGAVALFLLLVKFGRTIFAEA
jgi:hypothetical protein